jgi:hypothetical protein
MGFMALSYYYYKASNPYVILLVDSHFALLEKHVCTCGCVFLLKCKINRHFAMSVFDINLLNLIRFQRLNLQRI